MRRVDITLTLNLPQELAEQAKSAGLLNAEQIERWLAEEVERQRKLERFFGKMDRLTAIEPPLTEEEIHKEIETYRREKRSQREDNGE